MPVDQTAVRTKNYQNAVTDLIALRQSVERELASIEWQSESHADTEALAFMQLAIANVAAVEVLAKADFRFAVAATATARAAYEAVVTSAWMLATLDLAERDKRWMALFIDERAYWQRMAKEAQERKDEQRIIDDLSAEVARVQAIIDEVGPQLPSSLGKLTGLPTADVRLDEVGQDRNYVVYKTACQFVHPTTRMLAQVRDLHEAHSDEGPIASYHFRTTERDWTTALLLSAEAMAFGLDTLCRRTAPGRKMSDEVVDHFNGVVTAVRATSQTNDAN